MRAPHTSVQRQPQTKQVMKEQPRKEVLIERRWGQARPLAGKPLTMDWNYANDVARELGLVKVMIGNEYAVVRVDELQYILRNV